MSLFDGERNECEKEHQKPHIVVGSPKPPVDVNHSPRIDEVTAVPLPQIDDFATVLNGIKVIESLDSSTSNSDAIRQACSEVVIANRPHNNTPCVAEFLVDTMLTSESELARGVAHDENRRGQ